MNDIKIRYTWKRDSDGSIIQRIVELRSLEEKGLILGFSEYRLIARDLWIGVQDCEGEDIFNNDTFECPTEDGNIVTGVVKYGSHRRVMNSGKAVDINGFSFVIDGSDFRSFPIANNYLGKHDLEIIKITGNIHQPPTTS